MEKQGEIILYQPDQTIKLEVYLENETVWLTQAQMSELFQRERTVITKHINNVFKENELDEKSNVQKLHIAFSDKPIKAYSLDVIISVGYRVKSMRGTQFRQFANKVLKEYMIKGYAVNQRLEQLEKNVGSIFLEHDRKLAELSNQIDFFVKTSLPPIEGVFFDGQIFDAYVFATNLVKSAKKSLILIDNYVDESVLLMLAKRSSGVSASIYTAKVTSQLQLDLRKHNSQYPIIEIHAYKHAHDRFIIIDDQVYHIGASLKDLGKKLFAFSKLNINPDIILKEL